jgi:predicted ABC-type ATPase
MHYDDKSGYSKERKKLHAEIINGFKKDVVCITKGSPIAILMGGSPASGKSSFLKKYSPFLLSDEILKIDADEIRAKLPEYKGYNASQTHLETKDIVNTLIGDKNIGIPCDFDLIYDGTMNSVKSYIPLIDLLKKRGYKVFIVYMDNVPKEVIEKRVLERYQKAGRFVPLEVVDDFFEKGKTAFDNLKKDVDGYMIVDGSSQDYKIIEKGGMSLPKNRAYSKLGEKITKDQLPKEYAKGGKVSFKEKSTAIAKKFVGKKVEPKYQKEFGKTYDKEEAKLVGSRIAGSQKAKYDEKMTSGGKITQRGRIMKIAKEIRKDGESWQSALKRASMKKE